MKVCEVRQADPNPTGGAVEVRAGESFACEADSEIDSTRHSEIDHLVEPHQQV